MFQGKFSGILKVFEKNKVCLPQSVEEAREGLPGGGKHGESLWRGGTQSWLSGNEDPGEEEEDDRVGAVSRGPCLGLQMWSSSPWLSDNSWPGRQAPGL